MRVLYLTNSCNRASTTVPLEGWLRNLRGRGLQPVLVTDRRGPLNDWATAEGIPSYDVRLPFPNKKWPWRFLTSLIRLRRLVAQHNIQLIHCNEQDIYPIGQYLSKWCRLPVVVSIHYMMNQGFCQWAFGRARAPQRMFFISEASRDACRHALDGLIPESTWRLLYNGLDMDKFQPNQDLRQEFRQKLHLESDLLLGAACALRSRKQLEHLFEAAARLKDPRVRVVVAGGAPRVRVIEEPGYAEAIIDQGRKVLGERFVHLGRLDELRGFYNGLDLFVNTSKEESFGLTSLEAMACGTPVVGYPSLAVQEVVLPGGGEIVKQDNIDQLAEALERWLSEPERLAAARQDARRRAEECFDIRKIALQLWDEYQSLCN